MALRSFLERLLRIGVDLQVMMFSIALRKASRVVSSVRKSPRSLASEAFHFITRISLFGDQTFYRLDTLFGAV